MIRLFRRAPAPAVAEPVNLGRALNQVKADKSRALRRAMTDRLRADLLAKGHARMTPIDWSTL